MKTFKSFIENKIESSSWLDKNVETKLSDQINLEFYSMNLYFYFESIAQQMRLEGFASWFRKSAVEELDHAKKILDFVYNRQGNVNFKPIIIENNLKTDNIKSVLDASLLHEKKVTQKLTELSEISEKESDKMTYNLMLSMIEEQIEEEKKVQLILDDLKLSGLDQPGLFLVDKILVDKKLRDN